MTDKELYQIACDMRRLAYSPYSGITVGAALLAASGKVYTGINIENAAYSPGVCAERCAFFTAVASGEREFCSIAIAGGKAGEPMQESFPPCGVCRQVMTEFCKDDFKIILSSDKSVTLGELLPYTLKKELVK